MVKEFAFYLDKGDVKRQKPDVNLSAATLNEGEERLEFALSLQKNAKPKYVLENAYESMREAADALLYAQGFKSYSHEASISYLPKDSFSDAERSEFDRFRKIRNGIKYYGGDCTEEDAENAIALAQKIIPKIKSSLKKGSP